MSALIAVEQLTKWYGPRLAVDRVSLTVHRGEIMGLLGPNGSGKTTILRVLAGYLRPSAGIVRIGDLDVVRDSLAARRHVGYVPEDAPLYGGMGVGEFLVFMGRLKGLAAARLTDAVDVTMERLGLGPVRGVHTGRLSRGYRQRVAIAQALLGNPDVLILDEPTHGLDPRQIIEMRELIRALGGERTVLVTSHILGEIERVADRVAILLEGRLLGIHALRAPDGCQQRLRLRVRGDETGVRACLARVPGVTALGIERESGTSVATYVVEAEGAAAPEAVASAVVGSGFGLLGLEQAAVDLEALFLRLTGERAEVPA
jgi:ABC-2 type transport system ATP-binding protein